MKKPLKLNPKKLNPKSTRIVVIDLQNDFCHPKSVYKTKREKNSETAKRVHEFVKKAEKFEIETLYFQQIYDESKLSDRQIRYYKDNKISCEKGSFGAEYFEITPPKDKLFTKYNFDLWQNKQFQKYLDDKNIDTLIFTGVEILCCVLFAIMGADERGFNLVVPKDLVSSVDGWEKEAENILDFVGKLYGPVVPSSEILNVWQK